MPFLTRRTSLACVLVAVIAPPAFPQILVIDPETAEAAEADRPAEAEREVQILEVSPAAEPVPALRWRFWPAPDDRRPGNAAVSVQRAIIHYLDHADRRELEQQLVERWDAWFESDLEALPRDEVREYLERHRVILRELEPIATMERSEYDFRVQDLPVPAAFELVLSELQNMRPLARRTALDIRLALAEGRIDDAVAGMRTGIRLGEVAGTAMPLLIGRLIGIAITSQTLDQVQLAMTRPDAPNFYWALTTLPDSLWEMHDAVEYEIAVLPRVLPTVAKLPEGAVSEESWRDRLLTALSDFHRLTGIGRRESADPAEEVRRRVMAGLVVVALDGPARDALEAIGEDASGMSPSEAIIRATHHSLIHQRDERLKWWLLPDPPAEKIVDERLDPVALFSEGNVFPAAGVLMDLVLPAAEAAAAAEKRGRQTRAFLATIEALRMHAAAEGRFPESLEGLQPVPAWNDPVTEEPFQYELRSANEAVLTRASTQGWSPPATILRLRE